jgi:predicted ATP-grasp superfamily ATP-dependent carboligase
MVPGDDRCLVITACYFDRNSRWVAGFNAQKLVQCPEGFGTGCIVQSVARPELLEPTIRLLESIGYSGLAEVEFKWDARTREYKLIEINPRPWDQHRLGNAAGVDLIYAAYCDHTGETIRSGMAPAPGHKWVAEDTFFTTLIRLMWRGGGNAGRFRTSVKGKRIYAIWSAADPLPSIAYWVLSFIPEVSRAAWHVVWSRCRRPFQTAGVSQKEFLYEAHVEKPESLG